MKEYWGPSTRWAWDAYSRKKDENTEAPHSSTDYSANDESSCFAHAVLLRKHLPLSVKVCTNTNEWKPPLSSPFSLLKTVTRLKKDLLRDETERRRKKAKKSQLYTYIPPEPFPPLSCGIAFEYFANGGHFWQVQIGRAHV